MKVVLQKHAPYNRAREKKATRRQIERFLAIYQNEPDMRATSVSTHLLDKEAVLNSPVIYGAKPDAVDNTYVNVDGRKLFYRVLQDLGSRDLLPCTRSTLSITGLYSESLLSIVVARRAMFPHKVPLKIFAS